MPSIRQLPILSASKPPFRLRPEPVTAALCPSALLDAAIQPQPVLSSPEAFSFTGVDWTSLKLGRTERSR
jgi:hypothetical protein